MVDLTKPCVKCGEVDRYSNGKCKPCQKAAGVKYRQSDKGRERIRKYCQSDEVRAKTRERQRRRARRDEVREKTREHARKRRQTAIGRQRHYAARLKYKKTLFQFSLQNQQTVIKQFQQEKTSRKEG